MKVAFRVDASARIGTGHVVRCLTLAERLASLGADCTFVMRQHAGHMCELVRTKGFSLHALAPPAVLDISSFHSPTDYFHWLGTTIEEDAKQTLRALQGPVDWLVVDHYALDHIWEKALRTRTGKIAVIDDLADRPHECDLLLDQNFFAFAGERYSGFVSEDCIKLIGPRYALLQTDYKKFSPERSYDTPIKSIIVFYGGSDLTDETSRALRVLSQEPFLCLKVNVVVGASNRNRDSIESLCAKRPRTTLHSGLRSLGGLMAESDMAIGAVGTSTWERCALGLPTVVTSVAENQLPVARELTEADLVYYVGDWRSVCDASFRQVLLHALTNQTKNTRISVRSRELTDAYGADRVAECMMPSNAAELILAPTIKDHRQIYFHWVNDPSVRKNAFNSDPVIWQEHCNWFDRKLSDPDCHMWVLLTRSGLPVGQIRLEPVKGEHLIAFSIDQLFRARGLGTILLERMLAEICRIKTVKRVVGEVKAGNKASVSAFRKTGVFRETVDEARNVHVFSLSDCETETRPKDEANANRSHS